MAEKNDFLLGPGAKLVQIVPKTTVRMFQVIFGPQMVSSQ